MLEEVFICFCHVLSTRDVDIEEWEVAKHELWKILKYYVRLILHFKKENVFHHPPPANLVWSPPLEAFTFKVKIGSCPK